MRALRTRWWPVISSGAVTGWAYALLSASPLLAQAPGRALTPSEIEEAIRLGREAAPAPYLLHFVTPVGSPTRNPVIVGAVYTPFLRVALASKAARAEGRRFTSSDVSGDLAAPVVYVAFRWYCCDGVHGSDPDSWDPFKHPFDYKIAAVRDAEAAEVDAGRAASSRRRPVATPPIWIKYGASVLDQFGGQPPFRDVVIVAAYPMSVLSTRYTFTIYRESPSATAPSRNDRFSHYGRITAEDLERWR